VASVYAGQQACPSDPSILALNLSPYGRSGRLMMSASPPLECVGLVPVLRKGASCAVFVGSCTSARFPIGTARPRRQRAVPSGKDERWRGE
jgi:hypothetical protein